MLFPFQKSAFLTDVTACKIAWTILSVVLVISVGPSAAASVNDECGGTLSDAPFSCFMDAIEYCDRCTFPTAKLNATCILSSCPGLKGLNPINSNGTVDQMVLSSIITVLNKCLTTTATICGITVPSTPMVQLGWTMDQLFPAYLGINGSCILNKGAGAVNNLNQARFSLAGKPNPNGPVTLTFGAPNITQTTTWNCSMSISTTLLKLPIPENIQLFNFPEMKGLINITVQPTLEIDTSANPVSFRVLNDNSSISLRSYNYVSCALDLPPVLVDLLNLSINKFFKASETTVYASQFLSTFATQGINAAIQSCD